MSDQVGFLVDYPDGADTNATPGDPSHVLGDMNAGTRSGRIPVSTYQWIIVVGALAALWALHFAFRSDLKVG